MPSEEIGQCGKAQSRDRKAIVFELEFGIACLRHREPEPPGCSLEIRWHEHDLGDYPTISLVWEEPGSLFEEHWAYIERCKDVLDQLDGCVDWEALHAIREKKPSERLTTPTAPPDPPAELVTLTREPSLLRLFLRWTLLGGSLLFSLSLTVLGTVGMIEEGPTPGGLVFLGFLVCFGGLSVGILAVAARHLGLVRGGYLPALAVVVLVLFALLVWPTPFVYFRGPGRETLIRVNRITGHAQYVVPAAPNR